MFQSATPVFETGVYRYVFWVAWFLAVLFYLIGGFFFVRALWGNAYTFLASPNENEKYYQELRLQHKDERKAKKNARKKFRRHIYESFRDHSSTNSVTNDNRSLKIYRATTCFLITTLISMFLLGGHYLESHGAIKEIQPIEVIIRSPIQTTDVNMTGNKGPTPTKNQAPVKEPATPPSPRRVIENYSPKQSDPSTINEKNRG